MICGQVNHVTSHPGQLSLAIPPRASSVSTSKSWGVNGLTTSLIFMAWQCICCRAENQKSRSSLQWLSTIAANQHLSKCSCRPMWLGKNITFTVFTLYFSYVGTVFWVQSCTTARHWSTQTGSYPFPRWHVTSTQPSEDVVWVWPDKGGARSTESYQSCPVVVEVYDVRGSKNCSWTSGEIP